MRIIIGEEMMFSLFAVGNRFEFFIVKLHWMKFQRRCSCFSFYCAVADRVAVVRRTNCKQSLLGSFSSFLAFATSSFAVSSFA